MNLLNTKMVKKWFEKSYGGSLKLPDGWFGRPYDNIHTLKSVDGESGKLTIQFNDGNSLNFLGLNTKIKNTAESLSFSNYDEVVFKWFDDNQKESNCTYKDGTVSILRVPGM